MSAFTKSIASATIAAIAVMAVGAIATTHADAQVIYRDAAGRIVGTSRDNAMPFSNGSTQFYDGSGRSVGSASGDGYGGYRMYDNSGREVGSAEGY